LHGLQSRRDAFLIRRGAPHLRERPIDFAGRNIVGAYSGCSVFGLLRRNSAKRFAEFLFVIHDSNRALIGLRNDSF
jgi:hypothetical protein